MEIIQLRLDVLKTTSVTGIAPFGTITNSFESLTIVTEITVENCGCPKDWNLAQLPVHIRGFGYLFAENLNLVFFERLHTVLLKQS